MTLHFPFDNSYARLPARLFAELAPTPVRAPRLVALNQDLARAMGLDPAALATPEGAAILAGNTIPAGAQPIAQAYAGHQFGHWNPQLGDGRAILLGEVVGTDGLRRDIQLKGAGRTPGRAAVTVAPGSAPFSANTSAPRRWPPSASPPPAPLPPR